MTVKFLEELNDFEKLALIPMSYSRLNTFEMCRAKYFYSYIQKEPQIFGEAAVLGNIIHKVLEEKLEPNQTIQDTDIEVLLESYEQVIPDFDPDQQINAGLIEAGKGMLVDFVDRHEGEAFPIYGKELHFNLVIGPALIVGYIDRVDIEEDLITITDYKSGKHEITFKDAATNMQLGIYALAMSKLLPGKDIYAEHYYLRTGRQKGHRFSSDDLIVMEEMIVDRINEVISEEQFGYTSNSRFCSFCDYAKSGTCTYGRRHLRR